MKSSQNQVRRYLEEESSKITIISTTLCIVIFIAQYCWGGGVGDTAMNNVVGGTVMNNVGG